MSLSPYLWMLRETLALHFRSFMLERAHCFEGFVLYIYSSACSKIDPFSLTNFISNDWVCQCLGVYLERCLLCL
ncbi:hypothetical protein BC827DRAFT_633675 [Russula dissimulans]|nr:hypothetical protein BC827DRAFT_633675 [Russula dissimulans]